MLDKLINIAVEKLSALNVFRFTLLLVFIAAIMSEALLALQGKWLLGNAFDKNFLIVGFTTPIIISFVLSYFTANVLQRLKLASIKAQDGEKKIAAQSRQLRHLSNNIPNGFIYQIVGSLDGHRQYLYVGEGVKNITGLTVEEVLENPMSICEQILPEDAQKVAILEAESLKNKTPFAAQLRIRTKDGATKWLSVNAIPRYIEDGKFVYDGIAMDITAQKNIEDELEILNEQLQEKVQVEVTKNREKEVALQKQSRLASMGEMIGNISHQWRQPLNALAMKIQDVPMALQCGGLNKEYADNLKSESMELIRYMSQTIEDFRSFFKPDKEKKSLMWQTPSIKPIR